MVNRTSSLKRTELKRTGTLQRGPSELKARRRMARRGKKTVEWETVRAALKVIFARLGVVRCQQCGTDNYLGFAHCRKRTRLLDGEIWHCALLCNPCHDLWEYGDAGTMHDEIHRLRRRDGLE